MSERVTEATPARCEECGARDQRAGERCAYCRCVVAAPKPLAPKQPTGPLVRAPFRPAIG